MNYQIQHLAIIHTHILRQNSLSPTVLWTFRNGWIFHHRKYQQTTTHGHWAGEEQSHTHTRVASVRCSKERSRHRGVLTSSWNGVICFCHSLARLVRCVHKRTSHISHHYTHMSRFHTHTSSGRIRLDPPFCERFVVVEFFVTGRKQHSHIHMINMKAQITLIGKGFQRL